MAHILGRPIDRIDGSLKVTGSALYAGDNRLERMAFGWIVPASIARGRIVSIDAANARRMPGVLLVMTHENAPRQAAFQPRGEDRHGRPKPALAGNEVRHFGQPVALVVAETPETARAAAEALTVTYDKAPGAFALDAASGDAHDPGKTTAGMPTQSKLGDFEDAFGAAPVHVDQLYTTPYQSHAMMDPHAHRLLATSRAQILSHVSRPMRARSQR